MRRSVVLVTLLGTMGPIPGTGQVNAPPSAVVTIMTRLSGGRTGFGHGFFIAPSGRVLTAYHVIQGAQQITVLHQGQAHTDVVIERISPDLDLATLNVGDAGKSIPYLNPVRELPSEAYRETLSLGIVDHPLATVRMTAPGYVASGRLPVRLEKIFAVDTVRLLSLGGLVYSGWSGAAVIAPQGVVGVLSGSFNEGGSIVWAIPTAYLWDPTMRGVNLRPAEVRDWPPLRLMTPAFTSLRRTVRIDDRMLGAVQAYFQAVEELDTAQQRLPEVAGITAAGFRSIRLLLSSSGRRAFSEADSVLLTRFEERMTALTEAADSWVAAQNRLLQRTIAVAAEVQDVHGDLPRTQHNLEVSDAVSRAMDALQQRGNRANSTEVLLQEQAQASGKVVLAALRSADTAGAFLVALEQLEGILLRWTSPEVLLARVEEARFFHQFGVAIERLLRADFDARNASWSWASGKGYELMLPAGWELSAAPDSADVQPLVAQLAASGRTLDMTFALQPEGEVRAGLLVVGRWNEPMRPEKMDSLMRSGASVGGLRIERVHLAGAEAMFMEAKLATGVEITLRCDGVVAAPRLTVFFRLSPPPGRPDLGAQCRGIIEHMTFTAP